MEFRILGRLEAIEHGQRLELGGARQRALLAVLLLHRNAVVSLDRLVDELWGEHPPPTATKTVQVYVSRLRKVLGPGTLETRGRGYLLAAGPDAVDADRFDSLAADGRRALAAGDACEAAELLAAALSLWRGGALEEFGYEAFAQREIERLEEARLAALEDRIDAELATGRGSELVPELELLVAQHPLTGAADSGTDGRAVPGGTPVGRTRCLSNLARQARRGARLGARPAASRAGAAHPPARRFAGQATHRRGSRASSSRSTSGPGRGRAMRSVVAADHSDLWHRHPPGGKRSEPGPAW